MIIVSMELYVVQPKAAKKRSKESPVPAAEDTSSVAILLP